MDDSLDKLTAEQKGQLGFQALLNGNHEYAALMLGTAIEELRARAAEDVYYTLCLDGLGQVRLCQARLEEAEALFQEAFELYEEHFGQDLFGKFSTLCHLAAVFNGKGLYDEAKSLYQRALSLGEASLGSKHVVLAHACLEGYAETLHRLGLDYEAQVIESRINAILAT